MPSADVAAPVSFGGTPSTLCAEFAATALWVGVTVSLPCVMTAPLWLKLFAAMATPSVSSSPSATG